VSKASTNFSRESGGVVRPPLGPRAQRTSGSVFMSGSQTRIPCPLLWKNPDMQSLLA